MIKIIYIFIIMAQIFKHDLIWIIYGTYEG